MNKQKAKYEERNLGVTVIAGCIFVLLAFLATATFNINDATSIVVSAVLALIALISLAVAIYGRKQPLKDFLESIFYFPF